MVQPIVFIDIFDYAACLLAFEVTGGIPGFLPGPAAFGHVSVFPYTSEIVENSIIY